MGQLSRRGFLKDSAILAAGGVALELSPSALAREPRIQFPTEPRARLTVTSWPFRAYIESPANRYRNPNVRGMDLVDFAAMVVEKFGIHNINPLSWHFRSTEAS